MMKYPFVQQEGAKDCGVCSLLMILKFYGGSVSKEYLRELSKTTKKGVNASNLKRAAEQCGVGNFQFAWRFRDAADAADLFFAA